MQTDQITIRVPQALAEAYRSAPPERQRKMELYMTLRLKTYEDAPDVSFEQAWARLGEEAEAHGLTEEKLEALLREIDEERNAERDAERGDSGSHLGDGYGDVS
jgi:hypothetical protein